LRALATTGFGVVVSSFTASRISPPDLVFWLLSAFTVLCVLASVAPKEYRSVAVRS
jgi:hypothetical protein